MDATTRIERALEQAVDRADIASAPPRLAAAIRHAVFPGGAWVRPRLCLAVAKACGEDNPGMTDAAAAAIELIHCASLVHDDLPCFDDAETRRNKPSVHKAFGEPLAVLTGDALIIMAFETLGQAALLAPARLPRLVSAIARAAGTPAGITAGQAWECEPSVTLADYHRAKTGALFAGATIAGAVAAGAEPDGWRTLGERLGEAYQVADDIKDLVSSPADIGKPCGQDAAHGRLNAPRELGLAGSIGRLEQLLAEAVGSIPACPGAAELRGVIIAQSKRFVPKELAAHAA